MANHSADQHYFASSLPDLLLRHHRGDSAFISPRQALLAEGVAFERRVAAAADIPQAAAQLLHHAQNEGWKRAVLVGAIPFLPNAEARLFVPRYVEMISRDLLSSTGNSLPQRHEMHAHGRSVRMMPTPEAYQQLVARAVQQIRQGAFEKVVLSRSLQVETQIDLPALLTLLAERNPQGYTFAVDQGHAAAPSSRTLVGASPELLLSKRAGRVFSNPLAGSIARSADPDENRRRAKALLSSAKDRHEHALVVEAVASALRPFCSSLRVPTEPSVISTPSMLHLSTEIHGELNDSRVSSLTLAMALHPTPAVCGHPTQEALRFIAEEEGFDRGYFTGLVGWCGPDGNGEWAIAIRCAEVAEKAVTLYAGAGVVADSEPAAELAETSAKLRTMLSAMGLEAVLGAV